MPDDMLTHDPSDEIDLLEALEILWAEKSLILASSVLAVLAALAILLTSSPTFEVKTPYYILSEPLSCGVGDCNDYFAQQIYFISQREWVSVGSELTVSVATEAPKSAAEYQSDLREINRTLRASILKKAEVTEYLIENEISSDLLGPEMGITLMRAKRISAALKEEGMPLAFGSISIAKSKQNFPFVLFITALCGALVGSVLVFLQKAFRDRRIAAEQIGL